MPKSKPNPNTRLQARFNPQRDQPTEMIELVDPTWILKALGLMLGLGILCAYITICALFHYHQWQLVLHPSRTVATVPSVPYTEVHFAPDDTGQPQLDGWWIPSDTPLAHTVLLLHSGDGSMADALPDALTLHNAQLNVLLFDYRGFGHSGGKHPTQTLMQQDAANALTYLTTIRAVPLDHVLVYGTGLGGSLAVQLCSDHQSIPALILNAPDGDYDTRARADVRARIVPFALFTQHFQLAAPLQTLATPKLLISTTNGAAPVLFQRAADPKMTVELPPTNTTALQQALHRFLDTYTATP